MVYRAPKSAPQSRVPEERRGRVVGRFCHGCNQVFAFLSSAHKGDPIAGRDHVASTCAYEGRVFDEGASWWEPAVEVLPPPPAEPAPPLVAGAAAPQPAAPPKA